MFYCDPDCKTGQLKNVTPSRLYFICDHKPGPPGGEPVNITLVKNIGPVIVLLICDDDIFVVYVDTLFAVPDACVHE